MLLWSMHRTSRIHQFEWVLPESALGKIQPGLKTRPGGDELMEADAWQSSSQQALSALAQMLRVEGIPKMSVKEGEPVSSPLDEAVATVQVLELSTRPCSSIYMRRS